MIINLLILILKKSKSITCSSLICYWMLVETLSYISRIALIYLNEIPLALRLSQMIRPGMLSYAFSKSMNTICKSFLCSLYFSLNLLKTWIALRPSWHETEFVIFDYCLLSDSPLYHSSHNFIVWLWSLIPLQFPHTCASLLFLYSGISVMFLYSSGILCVLKTTLKRLVS